MIPKGQFVTDCRDGDSIRAVFLISQCRLLTARNGKPYAKLLLTDKSGDITGFLWEDARQQISDICQGDVVGVRGIVESYDGRLQIKVEKVMKLDEDKVDLSTLIATTSRDIPAMAAELDTTWPGSGVCTYGVSSMRSLPARESKRHFTKRLRQRGFITTISAACWSTPCPFSGLSNAFSLSTSTWA